MTVGTTLSVNGVDIGSKITNFEGRISSNTSNISRNSTSIGAVTASVATLNSTVYGVGVFPFATPGLVSVVAANTASIVGISTSIASANGRIDDNENYTSSLNSNKQNNITAQTDITSKNIIFDNLTLNPPDLEDIAKGSITATLINTNIGAALG